MKTNENLGITLVSLVITIIILLILAGITISQLTGSGLFENAKLAEEKAENAQKYENGVLSDYEQWMGNYLGDQKTNSGGTNTNPDSDSDLDEDTGNGLIIETETTHTVSPLTYTWEELKEIAKIISDNDDIITNDTLRVEMAIGKKIYVLGAGDTAKVNYSGAEKTVKILGFNHDKLANKLAYGGQEENTYAGITFIFTDNITNGAMNSSNINTGGWEATEIRKELNETLINNFENKDYIKEVVKDYVQTYNDENTVDSCTDKLWLLSCSEIWNNGYATGKFGWAIAKEGEQYKYYKNVNPSYSLGCSELMLETWNQYWIRSPYYERGDIFCSVNGSNGAIGNQYATSSQKIVPGFSI